MTSSEDRCILCGDWEAYSDGLCYECFVNVEKPCPTCDWPISFDEVECIACYPDQ